MDWITETIAIGNFLDAQDVAILSREGIRSILGLDGKLRGTTASDLGVARIEVFEFNDGPGNDPQRYQQAVDTLRELVEENSPVLVHCHAGRSRSPIVVAGYFVLTEGMNPEDAINRVAGKREINISEGLDKLLYWLRVTQQAHLPCNTVLLHDFETPSAIYYFTIGILLAFKNTRRLQASTTRMWRQSVECWFRVRTPINSPAISLNWKLDRWAFLRTHRTNRKL